MRDSLPPKGYNIAGMKRFASFFLFAVFTFSLWSQSDRTGDFYFSSLADEISDLLGQAENADVNHPADKLNLASRAYDLASGEGMKEAMAKSRALMGVAYFQLQDLEKSLDFLTGGYEDSISYGYDDVTWYSAFNLGNVYTYLNNREKARFYYNIALTIVALEDSSRHGEVLGKLVELNRDSGDYDEAWKFAGEAQAVSQTSGDPVLVSRITLLSGQIHFLSGKTGEAVNILLPLAVQSGDTNEDMDIKSEAMSLLARCYSATGDYSRALSYGQDALLLSVKNDRAEGRLKAYDALSVVYEQMGDYRKAFEYQDLYYGQKDILEREKNQSNVDIIRAYYETKEKEKEIDRQLLTIESQNRLILIGSLMVVVLLVLLLVFYLLYRKNSRIAEKLSRDLKREMILSKTDPVTGLPNRKDLEERISAAIGRWKKNRRNFSLLLISFEKYKKIDKENEGENGEKLQKHIGALLQAALKGQDTVGLWKPFLFAVLLPETDSGNLKAVEQTIALRLEEKPFILDKEPLPLVYNTGSCTYSGEGSRSDCIDRCREALKISST